MDSYKLRPGIANAVFQITNKEDFENKVGKDSRYYTGEDKENHLVNIIINQHS